MSLIKFRLILPRRQRESVGRWSRLVDLILELCQLGFDINILTLPMVHGHQVLLSKLLKTLMLMINRHMSQLRNQEMNVQKYLKTLSRAMTSCTLLITINGWLRNLDMELEIKEMKTSCSLLEMLLLDLCSMGSEKLYANSFWQNWLVNQSLSKKDYFING